MYLQIKLHPRKGYLLAEVSCKIHAQFDPRLCQRNYPSYLLSHNNFERLFVGNFHEHTIICYSVASTDNFVPRASPISFRKKPLGRGCSSEEFSQLRTSRKSSQSSQIRVFIFRIITLRLGTFVANFSDRKAGLKIENLSCQKYLQIL